MIPPTPAGIDSGVVFPYPLTGHVGIGPAFRLGGIFPIPPRRHMHTRNRVGTAGAYALVLFLGVWPHISEKLTSTS